MKKITLKEMIQECIKRNYIKSSSKFELECKGSSEEDIITCKLINLEHLNDSYNADLAKQLKNPKILDVPVNKVYINYTDGRGLHPLVTITDREHYAFESKDLFRELRVKYGRDFTDYESKYVLRFNVSNPSCAYIHSFLYEKDYWNIHLYQCLINYGNTIMNEHSYDKALTYIKCHKDTLDKMYKIKTDKLNLHECLEKYISSICGFNIEIRVEEVLEESDVNPNINEVKRYIILQRTKEE